MCNRVKGMSKAAIRALFGEVILYEGNTPHTLDELPESPEMSFTFDEPLLPVLVALYPTPRIQLMAMKYLPREATGNPELQARYGHLYNARAETIFEKPAFKHSIRYRRGIVLTQGFYDYQGRGKKGGKEINQCYYISLKDGTPFYTAAIWDVCDGREGFAIITTEANPLMTEIHNKNPRQPHHLPQPAWHHWLNPNLTVDQIKQMLHPFPDDNMQAIEYDAPKPPTPGSLF